MEVETNLPKYNLFYAPFFSFFFLFFLFIFSARFAADDFVGIFGWTRKLDLQKAKSDLISWDWQLLGESLESNVSSAFNSETFWIADGGDIDNFRQGFVHFFW